MIRLVEAVALLIGRVRAVELLFSKEELLGLEVQGGSVGAPVTPLGDEPIVFDASGRWEGHDHWEHMLVAAADS